jgi:hypothetical protein
MTQEPETSAVLKELYGDVDKCELYTGLLCEYNLANAGAMLPHASHMCSLAGWCRFNRVETSVDSAWFHFF